MNTHRSDEHTNDPLIADDDNFYKVENWTKDGQRIEHMLHAGDNLDKAREILNAVIEHPPGIRLTIRERTRVLDKWPRE